MFSIYTQHKKFTINFSIRIISRVKSFLSMKCPIYKISYLLNILPIKYPTY